MLRPLDEMKRRARALHKAARADDPEAWRRLRRLPELRKAAPDPSGVQRRHALAAVARELGFEGWSHAVAVLKGAETERFGALMYPPHCSAHWNIWSASYEEARSIHEAHGGYLLPYAHHFVIVDRHFLETLGVSAEDPDWARIGADFVRPACPEARHRLVERVVQARLQ